MGSNPTLAFKFQWKKMFLPRSLAAEIEYCGEPLSPSSVLGLRPPGLEFQILCLEGSVISVIWPSSGGSPDPVLPIWAQRWPKTSLISFISFIVYAQLVFPSQSGATISEFTIFDGRPLQSGQSASGERHRASSGVYKVYTDQSVWRTVRRSRPQRADDGRWSNINPILAQCIILAGSQR